MKEDLESQCLFSLLIELVKTVPDVFDNLPQLLNSRCINAT